MPATLIGAFIRVRRIEPEGLITAALGISADLVMFVVASVIFRWFPGMGDLSWRPAALTCTSGLNISLFFYPVIESIAGMDGLTKVAWLDMLNLIFILTVIPLSFALAPKPSQSPPDTAAEAPATPSPDRKVGVELPSLDESRNATSGLASVDSLDLTESSPDQCETSGPGVRVVSVVDVASGAAVPDPKAQAASGSPTRKTASASRNGPQSRTEKKSSRSGHEATHIEASMSVDCKSAKIPQETATSTPQAATAPSHEAAPSMKELGKRISLKVGVNPPLWAIPIGLALGLSGVNLPPFLLSLQTTIASANSALSFFIIGLLLDVRLDTLKKLYKPALMSMAVRYSIGLTLGFVLYYTLGTLSIFSPLGRFILLIGFVMPTTVVTSVYAKEWGWDPAFPTLMVNLTIVVSFVLIWILSTAVGIPEVSSGEETSSSVA
eukprot:m51a1_g12890 hypothetical protein (438) ;mRNA; f:67-1380